MQKPLWLDKKVDLQKCGDLKRLLRGYTLHTVCEEARCPNIGECFSGGVATFLILGSSCTRSCQFCNIRKCAPQRLDEQEPQRVARAVQRLGLGHIVVTSPTRDDLLDGGAQAFVKTVQAIKATAAAVTVELLIPDFLGDFEALAAVAGSGADIIGHNLETVPSLYHQVRADSDYRRSLHVLSALKRYNRNILTKSGLMLGLGEKESEIIAVFKDLGDAGCDFLTLGQYLPPSLSHYPVQEYVALERFEYFKQEALRAGLCQVKSSPYTRSSYLAHTFFSKTPQN